MADPDWTKLFAPIDAAASSPSSPAIPNQPSAISNPQSAISNPQSPPAAASREISPGVFDMAASFGGSLAQFAAGGFRQVSKQVYDQRQATCQACEQYSHGSCLACGCYILAKVALPHEQCPLGKWKRE